MHRQTHAARIRAAPVTAPRPTPTSAHCIAVQGCPADVESFITFELRRISAAIRRRLVQAAASTPGASAAVTARTPALVGVDYILANSRLRLKPHGECGGSGRRPQKQALARGDSNTENEPPAPGACGRRPAEAHLAEVERRLQLSTARRPPRGAAEFNRTACAMSRAAGIVLQPELARPVAPAATRRPPVPPPGAATPAAQPRMEMVAGGRRLDVPRPGTAAPVQVGTASCLVRAAGRQEAGRSSPAHWAGLGWAGLGWAGSENRASAGTPPFEAP